MKTGVYKARKTNGENYYRASITFRSKHISLGSYQKEDQAHGAYLCAKELLSGESPWTLNNYPEDCFISYHRWVVLLNFRDNNIYFKNPIYLKKNYFLYYIDQNTPLKFDVEDLFYYAHHKIQRRGGYLFVTDYGMQTNLLSRYGIKNHGVIGRDYNFANGDPNDYRYSNIEVINRYHGVTRVLKKGFHKYIAKIHLNGDYVIGRYSTEEEAAIAYNKASLIIKSKGVVKNFPQNYLDGVDEITYAALYQRVRISKKILEFEFDL